MFRMAAVLVSILMCFSTSISAFLHFYVALALVASKKVIFGLSLDSIFGLGRDSIFGLSLDLIFGLGLDSVFGLGRDSIFG